MRRAQVITILLVVFLVTLAACGSTAKSPTPLTSPTTQGMSIQETQSPTPTPTATLTQTPSQTPASTPTPTRTPTSTPTPSPTPTPTPTPSPTPSTVTNVKITKICYDGLVPRTESDEYVELTNLGSEPLDLKGWVLKDISEGYPSFTFPSYVLQPGKSIRVYTNEIHPEYGGFSFESGKAVWNNSSPDTAALFNAQGQEASRKSY